MSAAGPRDYFHEEQRFRQPWLVALLVAVAAAVVIALATASPSLTSALLGAAVFGAAVAFVLAVTLVVDVREDAITISFRYLWPTRRVTLSDIRSYEAVRYRPFIDYLGYGVRYGPKGLAYNVSGDRGVRIELRDGGHFLIGSQRAEELADAIGRAMEVRRS